MFCKYCGNVIDGDSVFCKVCGKNIIAEYSMQEPVSQVYATQEPAQTIEYISHTEIVPEPKKKKSVAPYILLPVAYVVAGLMAMLAQNIIISLISIWTGRFGSLMLERGAWISQFLGVAAHIIVFFGILLLFSLCCKGFNKKLRFIQSCYASQVGVLVSMVIAIFIGFIILFTSGFDHNDELTIYSIATMVCSIVGIFVSAPISILWFAASEKYTVLKGEKSNKSKTLMLPCILLGVYGIIRLVNNEFIKTAIFYLFSEWFGYFSTTFSLEFAVLITNIITYVVLFLLAIACKGGYKKLAFVGSALMAHGIASFISSLIYCVGSFVGYGLEEKLHGISALEVINVFGIVGVVLQYLLATALSIVFYILLNRYEVEKINKKA